MSLFSFRKPKALASLQQQGGELLGGVKGMAGQTVAHVGALLQLLCAELQQYLGHQVRRAVAVAAGALLLFFGYLVFCAFACVGLQELLGSWLLATGVVSLAHLVVGFIVLLIGVKSSPGPVAPATREELKNDWQCIKLLISKEHSKS